MFINISLGVSVVVSAVSILFFTVLYFIIFRNYNKRNEIKFLDSILNCIEYSVQSALHVFVLLLGIDYFIEGMLLVEAVYERYANLFVAVITISAVIYHYIKYVKKLFVDIDREQEKIVEKNTEKFAEYVFFIFLGLMMITPILYIPRAAAIMTDVKSFVIEVIKSIGCFITGAYLMVYMNPLEVIRKKENITFENQDEEVEEITVVENIDNNKEEVKEEKATNTSKDVKKSTSTKNKSKSNKKTNSKKSSSKSKKTSSKSKKSAKKNK